MTLHIVLRLISAAEVAAVVSLFFFVHMAVGCIVARLAKLETPRAASVCIAGGLAITTSILWYAYLAHETTKFVLPALVWFGTGLLALLLLTLIVPALLGARTRPTLKSWRAPSPIGVPLFALAASLFYHALSDTGRTELVLLANGDPYSWAMTADMSRSALSGIHGVSAEYWRGLMIDGAGTYNSFALMSQLRGLTAIETIPYFIIALAALIGLATYELLVLIYKIKRHVAAPLAIVATTSPFYSYIYLNGFFAQMLATFAALAALLVLLPAADQKIGPQSPMWQVKRGAALAMPISLLLISYQSGFVPFFLLVALTSAITLLFRSEGGLRNAVMAIYSGAAAPLAIALAAACVILPVTAYYLIERTVVASSVVAGWPVALIDPRYFLGLPTLSGFSLLNGKAITLYLYAPLFAACAFALMALHKLRSDAVARNITALVTTYIAFVALYLLIYLVRGDTYQTWKFAAFTVLPLTFAPLASLCYLIVPSGASERMKFKPVLSSAVLTGACALSLASWVMDGRDTSFTPVLQNFRKLSAQLQPGAVVALQTTPHIESFVALNTVRTSGVLIPLGATYFGATSFTDPVLNTPGLVTIKKARCVAHGDEIDNLQPPQRPHGDDDSYVIDQGWSASQRYHSFGGDCSSGSTAIIAEQGLSAAESWGKWSDGPNVLLRTPSFDHQALTIKFRINAFVANGKAQRVYLTVNGIYLGVVAVGESGVLTVAVPRSINQSSELVFWFSFPDRKKPSDIDPTSADGRDLAIGFVDFTVSKESGAGDVAAPKITFQPYRM